MLLRLATIGVVIVGLCSADTLTLRSGRVITGQYLGGDARHIRMAIGDHVDTFDVEDVGRSAVRRKCAAAASSAARTETEIGDQATAVRQTKASRSSRLLPAMPVAGIQIPSRDPDYRPHDRPRGFQRRPAGPDLSRQRG